MKKFQSNKIISFHENLYLPERIPENIEILFPQKDKEVKRVIKAFFKKYYNDNNPRSFIIGINPGRFGGGITGINFTAPRQLTENCGIPHSFKMQSELSAEFVYEVIEAFGGCDIFYKRFYVTAVSPLGFVKNGINLNYYDDAALKEAIKPFAIEMLQKQTSIIQSNSRKCICLGEGKNLAFLNILNRQQHFFTEIFKLPHPRFIMQYKRKSKGSYVRQYVDALKKISEHD